MSQSWSETWTWRYEDSTGAEVPGETLPRGSFPTQADAESWVGEAWRELLDGGVDAVSLLRDGEVVYAAMSLHPPEA